MKRKDLLLFGIPFLIVVIIFLFCVALYPGRVNSVLFLIASTISIFAFYQIKKRFSFGLLFVTIYYTAVVSLQMFLSMLLPSWLIGTRFSELYDESLFQDNGLMIEYFLLGTVFFFLVFFVSRFVESKKTKDAVPFLKNSSSPIPELIIFFFLVMVCVAQIYETRIGASGYIDYFVKGVSLLLLSSIVVRNIKYGHDITIKNIIFVVVAILIYGLPQITIGMRGDFTRGFIYTFVYSLFVNSKGVLRFVKKYFLVVCALAFGFLWAFLFVSSIKFAGGEDYSNNVFYLIVRRITGIFDGSSILKYLKENEVNLDFRNFIGVAFNEQRNHSTGYRANQIYTFFVQGYPTNDQTGSAAPSFASALFYGPLGWFLIIIYISLLNGLLSHKTSTYFRAIRNGCNDYIVCIKAFIMVYSLYIVVASYMMGGNYESIKMFSPAILAFLIISFISFLRQNKSNQTQQIMLLSNCRK